MPDATDFFDEQGLVDLARTTIADLRKHGISETEIKRLETFLRDGNVGEAVMLASLLSTILTEVSPDASQKKLLEVYRGLEKCCYSLVELGRNLFDVEAWQHYRACGYESFEGYCEGVFNVAPSRIQALKAIQNQRLPRPGMAGPSELLAWFFNAVEILGSPGLDHDLHFRMKRIP